MEKFIKKEFDPFKYNREVSHDILKTDLEYPLKYYAKDIKIGNDIIKKIFVLDIRTLDEDKLNYIFDNFKEIQRVIVSKYWYEYEELKDKKSLSTYPANLELIFLIDENRKYNINTYDYIYDLNYALKTFMTENELNKYINVNFTYKNLNKEILLNLREKTIKLNHFNYIGGANGSGKTRLLKEISSELKMPLYSMDDINIKLEKEIENKNNLIKFIYELTGSYYIDKYSDYSKYVYRLAQILEFSKENNNIVLLDDLRWNALDGRNRIKLVNTLKDYSFEHTPVVITGWGSSRLIKKKVYKSNIIIVDKYKSR